MAAPALAAFTGVRRRFEHRGTARGADFVDDYAHHPTEIAVTLAAARSHDGRRVIAVFQPHRYSRTASHWRPRGKAWCRGRRGSDRRLRGRRAPIPGVTGKLLVDALRGLADHPRRLPPRRAELAPFLAREVRQGDLVLTLGAGDITMVGEETLALIGKER